MSIERSTKRDRVHHAAETAEQKYRLSNPRTKDGPGRTARAAAEVVLCSHTQIIALES